jgi:heterodisulfide reductase subunit A
MKARDAVLVIGAGVGGIRASLDLAESGFKVYLCDRNPSMGGTLAQMDRWFPDNHCGMCKVLPVFSRDEFSQFCLRKGLVHPNIQLLSLSEVERVEGEAGDFSVTLRLKPSGVNRELCIGCGLCAQVCPAEVADEFDQGLKQRKAIYIPHPFISPKAYTIDRDSCTKCEACVQKCPAAAITLSEKDELKEVAVGAIILLTGFEELDPRPLTQYGYRRYPNVVTSLALERMLSLSGPSRGKLLRPSDGKTPSSIAFLQCVGSRDSRRDYCSSACCMYAIKEAVLAKEANPELDVHIFFMELRAFGKGYYRYYLEAKEKWGINFHRCRIPVVKEDPRTKDLFFTAKAEDGSLPKHQFELVVLSTGQAPSLKFRELTRVLGVESNKWGFCQTGQFSPVKTSREGIYVCGSASGPRDIADTFIGAGAAAFQASTLLSPSCLKNGSPKGRSPFGLNSSPSPFQGEGDKGGEVSKPLAQEEPQTAIFVCQCGGEVSSIVDTSEATKFSEVLPSVVYAGEVPYLCRRDALEEVVQKAKQWGADRLVLAACAPFIYGELPPQAMREMGRDYSLAQFVNLREEVAWVHTAEERAAGEKVKRLLAMAVERVRLQQHRDFSPSPVSHRALVVGGGLAGLVCALSIVERGFEVHLVERTAELGGNSREIYSTLKGGDPQALLGDLIGKAESDPLLHLHREAEVVQVTGYAGNFEITTKDKDSVVSLRVGAVILATGGEEYHPTEYLYGKSDLVVTQREMEEGLASGKLNPESLTQVVMIQCVGSRDEERPYCSRLCCGQALKNALKLKRENPEAEVFILYRDIMSYGFMEEYYTQAREAGVLFIRYELEEKPEVRLDGGALEVRVAEVALGGELILKPDLVVLSPAIVPQDNAALARMLDLDLTQEGFSQEAEVKFRPVDAPREGIFFCGLSLSPQGVEESIAQAQAAAQRAALLLGKERLESGGIVSEVNERRCTGCEVCVSACPYAVRVKDGERGVVVVREALCQGCGACAVACPSGAAKLGGFTERQVFSVLDVAV